MAAKEQHEIQRLVQAIHGTVRKHLATLPKTEFGNITSAAPLQVKMDGSKTPAPVDASDHFDPPLAEGHRVMVHTVNNKPVVLVRIAT